MKPITNYPLWRYSHILRVKLYSHSYQPLAAATRN